MQPIVLDKPYRFVPPYRGRFWSWYLRWWMPHHLRRQWGVTRVECRGVEHLRASLRAGHGIILAPNHCRPCDPRLLSVLARAADSYFFIMASWHVFMQSRWQRWQARRIGAFSVYREGADRTAFNVAVEMLAAAERPLVIFPEGVISRTNDRLNGFMEGLPLLARAATKKGGGKVVVHPVAIRYRFMGDVAVAVGPVLADLEGQLGMASHAHAPLLKRIFRVGRELLKLKEREYLGVAQRGPTDARVARLIEHILEPLEREWVEGRRDGTVVTRVKRLRAAILPDMVAEKVTPEERARRWRQLAGLYLAQQLAHYSTDYVLEAPTPDRLLETVERMEEDLTDTARIHRPLHAVIEVGPAIDAGGARQSRNGDDPLLIAVRTQLETMLRGLAVGEA